MHCILAFEFSNVLHTSSCLALFSYSIGYVPTPFIVVVLVGHPLPQLVKCLYSVHFTLKLERMLEYVGCHELKNACAQPTLKKCSIWGISTECPIRHVPGYAYLIEAILRDSGINRTTVGQ